MITIVNYGVGNLASIQNILKKIGSKSIITSNVDAIEAAQKIILPGVGAFDTCVEKLQQSGFLETLHKKVLINKTPVLGICVGMQLLFSGSEEGLLPGLNWVDGKNVKFDNSKIGNLKIPHMGWTDVVASKQSPILEGLDIEPRFYFVHSFHAVVNNQNDVLLTAQHGYNFTCAVEKENIIGAQFHPEKSHKFGMKLLDNFVKNY
jgi:imidazole glycerol-phosphate synthase subunit HisH